MAYRDKAADVESLAAPILEHAAALRKPVVVAIETECVQPRYVSFCGRPAAELTDAIHAIATALRSSPAFAGLAVHSYASWQLLTDQSG
jgi:hypothetical protein